MSSRDIPKQCWPGSLENLFDPATRQEAVEAGALVMTSIPHDELLNSQWFPRIQDVLPPNQQLERFYVLRPDHESKLSFANWLVEKAREDANILEPLRPVVEGIRDILIPQDEDGEN